MLCILCCRHKIQVWMENKISAWFECDFNFPVEGSHEFPHTYKEEAHKCAHTYSWRRGTARSLLVCHMRPVFTAWHRNRGERETNRRKKRKERRAGEPENVRKNERKTRARSTFLPSAGKRYVFSFIYDVWWGCVCSYRHLSACLCVSACVVLRIVAATQQPLCSSEHMVSDTSLSSAILSVYTA